VMIDLLNKPALPCPDINGRFRELTEEDDRCFLQNHMSRLSAPGNQRKNQQ
jgi:hypothetical protein